MKRQVKPIVTAPMRQGLVDRLITEPSSRRKKDSSIHFASVARSSKDHSKEASKEPSIEHSRIQDSPKLPLAKPGINQEMLLGLMNSVATIFNGQASTFFHAYHQAVATDNIQTSFADHLRALICTRKIFNSLKLARAKKTVQAKLFVRITDSVISRPLTSSLAIGSSS